jgi:putative ABC transport system permease protein
LGAGHLRLQDPAYRHAPAVDLRVRDAETLRERIDMLPGVEATALVVLGQGVARSGADAVGVSVMGIEPSVTARTSPVARRIVEGRFLEDGDGALVVVGRGLAERLRLAEGKKMVLSGNDAAGELVEALFRVQGIFETGSEELDGYLLLAPVAEIRRLYGLGAGEATQVGVLLDDPDAQSAMAARLADLAAGSGAVVRTWQEVMPELDAFIRLDRVSDGTFQALLLLLVLFTMFNTVLMSVLEREREFAVLLAIGTPPAQLGLQLLFEAAILGVLGTALGIAIGGGAALAVQVHGWDLSFLFPEGLSVSGFAVSPRVHALVRPSLLANLAALVFVATLVLALLPLRRALRIPIAETLR